MERLFFVYLSQYYSMSRIGKCNESYKTEETSSQEKDEI